MADVLVVNRDVPPRDRDSGSLRLTRLLELLCAEGHRVTLVARSSVGEPRHADELRRLGIEVVHADAERMAASGLLERGRFDLAILSFYDVAEQYLPAIRLVSPLTRIAIDTVDVHWVREHRAAQLAGSAAALAAAEATRAREAAVYGAADVLIAVSAEDGAALRELAPAVPVAVVSNVHDDVAPGPGFEHRDGVVFVGNFRHKPNIDAIAGFCGEAWPLVRAALPGATLQVVGTDPPPEVRALAGDGVEVTGWVAETAPYIDAARVSIAPLRYGAGVKGKIGEALVHGLPVVTTTIGAEGMDLVDGTHAMVADDPADFARAVVALHGDRSLWERLSSAGRSHARARFGREASRASVRELLALGLRTQYLAPAGWDAAPDALLDGYVSAFAPSDPVTLVLPVADAAAAPAAFALVAGALERLGRDPEAIPDVLVSALTAAMPRGAVEVPSVWAAPAGRPAAVRAPRAAVALHLSTHAPEARAQLDALAAAGVPDDVEVLVLADAPGEETEAVLASGAGGARILRSATTVGRSVAWQRAAEASRAPVVVSLGAGALAAPGFLEPLLGAVEGRAALVSAAVAGVAGYAVADDGSLWPAEGGDPVDALALDCLAATRELWLAERPALVSAEGHHEVQLAAWARSAGPLAVAPDARVDRLAGPPASVVVCTSNRADELAGCVDLLVAEGALAGGGEIVLLDNASKDATREVAAELIARHGTGVVYAYEPRPGLAFARNAGAAAARHDLLLYIDDDARPAPGWLSSASRALARPGVVNAGGPICALWPPERRPGWPGSNLERFLSVLDLGDAERLLVPPKVVYGANWAVRRSAMDQVGGFLEGFGPGGGSQINGDEVSVARRLHSARVGTTLYVPGASVGHRIAVDRVDDHFLLTRALRVGVERVRHASALEGLDSAGAVSLARGAALRLLRANPLSGSLSVEQALAAIGSSPAPLAHQCDSADALGELAAAVALIGESQVDAGDLRLAVRPEHLSGALAA